MRTGYSARFGTNTLLLLIVPTPDTEQNSRLYKFTPALSPNNICTTVIADQECARLTVL